MRILVFLFQLILSLCSATTDLRDLRPHEVALLQFDSRPLEDYWLASAMWNQNYAFTHGHQYLYYTLQQGLNCHYGDTELSDAWCKVKAMLQANNDHPSVKLFIYMDSDAVVDRAFENVSFVSFISSVQQRLVWDPSEKPMVFNQDGPCWWCTMIQEKGYKMCLNAGTVIWYRHSRSEEILKQWWNSVMDSYATNPLRRKFRTDWPWEQDRQMAIYNRTPEYIQIASHPHLVMMPWAKGSRRVKKVQDWCLSHLPGCGCFISHHCANPASKQVMRRTYTVSYEKRFLRSVMELSF